MRLSFAIVMLSLSCTGAAPTPIGGERYQTFVANDCASIDDPEERVKHVPRVLATFGSNRLDSSWSARSISLGDLSISAIAFV
jgi:hypothetical protein